MKKTRCGFLGVLVTVFGILLMVGYAGAATVYEQPPISWGHAAIKDRLIADDFQLDQATSITGIEWWGKYDTTNTYEVAFYTDVVDDSDGNHEPGTMLKTYTRTVAKEFYNDDNDHILFSVSGLDFAASADTRYWMSVKPIDASDWTGWRHASSSEVQYYEQYAYYDSGSGEWKPYATTNDYLHDLAFRLKNSPVPVPGALWLLGSGLLGLLGLRRRQKS